MNIAQQLCYLINEGHRTPKNERNLNTVMRYILL
jgi:hypothetical protein